MSRDPKKSALESLAQYEEQVKLLEDPSAVHAASARLRNELEGTVSVKPEGEPRDTERWIRDAGDAVVGDLTFDPGMALCMSGTGYRGMLFQIGALARMNEVGLLPKIDRIVSVSGGSIVAAMLGLKWNDLDFDEAGRAARFADLVVAPLRRLAERTIDTPGGLGLLKLLRRGEVPDLLPQAFARYLFGDATLQDLPDKPRLVMQATNLQSGVTWRFSKPYMGDYRVGLVRRPSLPLATAVAASSAFSAIHTVDLRLSESDFEPGSGVLDDAYRRQVFLTDGSFRDSLAVESAWNRYRTILVSDGGVSTQPRAKRRRASGARQLLLTTARINELVHGQVESLRRRQAINSFLTGLRSGAFWGLTSSIEDFGGDLSPITEDSTSTFIQIPGRLAEVAPETQEQLINWGYRISDAALRRHFDASLPQPGSVPYPANSS
jgi:NTE family protein